MDSDKANGSLYLDADDFLHGFLCHSQNCLSGRREESSLLFLLTDSQSLWLSVCIWDWLTDWLHCLSGLHYLTPPLALFTLSVETLH